MEWPAGVGYGVLRKGGKLEEDPVIWDRGGKGNVM